MAHFARIDDAGTVREVIVIDNELLAEDGTDEEALGQAYLAALGLEGTWVQTSYTGSFRGCFAGVGMSWTGTEFTHTQPDQEAPSA